MTETTRWRKFVVTLGGLVALGVGARIVLPGLNGQAVADYLRSGGGNFLLRLYDLVGGGDLSRGGALAVGVMPYLSARIMVRLARIVAPRLDAMTDTADGRTTLTRWTRLLTVTLAVVQSYGFARFVEQIPGAVPFPGLGFLTQTVLVLTAGSVVAMLVGERISAHGQGEEDEHDDDRAHVIEAPATPAQLEPGMPNVTTMREAEKVTER